MRIAALQSPQDFEAGAGYKETQEAAKAFSLRLHPVEVQSANDFEPAFARMNKAGETALLVILSPMITFNSRRIVELALKYRLPGMYPTKQFAEEGGLMAYGPVIADLYRRLNALYGSDRSREEKLAERAKIFEGAREELKSAASKFRSQRRVPDVEFNNAVVVAQYRYGRYNQFRRVFERVQNSWPAFFAAVSAAASSDNPLGAVEALAREP